MGEEGDVSLVQGVRMAAALVNELDGGKIPAPKSTDDRITERRKGELTIERVVPAQRNSGHPTIRVRRGANTLIRARLTPGWEHSNLRIEIVDYSADTNWIAELSEQHMAERARRSNAPIRLEKWQSL